MGKTPCRHLESPTNKCRRNTLVLGPHMSSVYQCKSAYALSGLIRDFGLIGLLPCESQCLPLPKSKPCADPFSHSATILAQVCQALIIGSVFYGTPLSTGSFFAKASVLFFAVLLSGLQSIVEINTLYAQRPIVSKHKSYAFYHPFAEALAGIVADLPVKLCVTTVFSIILYFLSGLRREAAPFFVFFLFNFLAGLTMSAIFRTVAAATKTISQAMAIAGVMILWTVIYTGFVLQRSFMHPWFKWTSWINPISYAFEALLVNEVHGREFPCAFTSLVPSYGTNNNFQCAVPGAISGERNVLGDSWLEVSFGYSYSHIWRNLGFIFAFMIFFYSLYLVTTELNSDSTSSAEFLIFRRGHVPAHLQHRSQNDEENIETTNNHEKALVGSDAVDKKLEENVRAIPAQKDVFTWRNVTFDIKIEGESRRLLDGISGWVKPGTLTALMGTSGAGKTTLLDALAQRTNIGVLTGDMVSNAHLARHCFNKIDIVHSSLMASLLMPPFNAKRAMFSSRTCTSRHQPYGKRSDFRPIFVNRKVLHSRGSMRLWKT